MKYKILILLFLCIQVSAAGDYPLGFFRVEHANTIGGRTVTISGRSMTERGASFQEVTVYGKDKVAVGRYVIHREEGIVVTHCYKGLDQPFMIERQTFKEGKAINEIWSSDGKLVSRSITSPDGTSKITDAAGQIVAKDVPSRWMKFLADLIKMAKK